MLRLIPNAMIVGMAVGDNVQENHVVLMNSLDLLEVVQ